MAKRDARVTRYIQKCAPFARPVLTHLRRTIHAGSRELEEDIKWGMPSFLYKGKIVCGMAGFKAHCALFFWKGKAVIKGAMGGYGRITKIGDLPSAAKLKAAVKKSVKLIEKKLS